MAKDREPFDPDKSYATNDTFDPDNPPDLPVELFLRINQASNEGLGDAAMVQSLYDEVLGLFRYKDPSVKSLPLGMGQLVGAIAAIYGDDTEADEQPAGPTTPSTRGASSKTKTRPRKRTASRSPN